MRPSSKPARKPPKRASGPRSYGDVARKLLTPALRRQGFAQHEIVTRWSTIVGALLGSKSIPERLKFPSQERRGGTLFVRVESAFALEFQHLTPQILDRVNTYYGYTAVEKVVIRQGVLPAHVRKRTESAHANPQDTMSQDAKKDLEDMLTDIPPGPLRDSLTRLGQQLLTASKPPHQK